MTDVRMKKKEMKTMSLIMSCLEFLLAFRFINNKHLDRSVVSETYHFIIWVTWVGVK